MPPVVGRFAGLPARALGPLRSPVLESLLQAREDIETELAEARIEVVDAIGEALPRFGRTERRMLLAVKRACFNGREISPHRRKPEWSAFLKISADLAERVLTLEEQVRAYDGALEIAYERELTRERRHVLGLVEDRRFVRGIAIGRPGLVRKVRNQAPALAASGFARPPAKWEESLLRFVTRAAAKLSANSTLTSYALGSVRCLPGSPGLHILPVQQREVSLVRLDRPQIEQFQTLLLLHPEVRRRAFVAWNDSAEEIEPGRFRFVRDGHWELDADVAEFRYVEPARVRVTPSSPLPWTAREVLRDGAVSYENLLATLEAENPPSADDGSDVRAGLEELLDLRLLILLPPWPTDEPWLERRISHFLSSTSEEKLSTPHIRDRLADLVEREEAFPSADRPERAVSDLQASFSRLLHSAAPSAGHQGPLTTPTKFFEDVLFEPVGDSDDDRGTFEVASSTIEEILQVVRLLWHFNALFNFQHDVQHTLAAWWRSNASSRRQIPFDELAERFAPIWREFVRFHRTAKDSALNTFNPLASPALAALRESRERLLTQARDLVGRSPAKDSISAPALADLLTTLPHRYAPLVGPSVFVQPADSEGSTWVLNNITEGTGRYLSRVVPALQGSRRARFLDHLIARSVMEVDGEDADILEVKHPWMQLVRAHPPQAARVLHTRGLHLDLPRERTVTVDELVVEADLESETFRLLDRSGRRVLPASLSTMSDSGLPNRLRLLLMFGLGESRGVFPFAWSEGNEEVVTRNRLTCANVVTRRRVWKIAIASLREQLESTTNLRSYMIVDRWRRRVGLPEEGYYEELASCGRQKPQFVRFDSPSLCRLFLSSLRKMVGKSLYFFESLPSSKEFPRDGAMVSRGFELLIDQLAIRDLAGNSSAR